MYHIDSTLFNTLFNTLDVTSLPAETYESGGGFFRSKARDRETKRQRDRETERQRDRETERQRDIERYKSQAPRLVETYENYHTFH